METCKPIAVSATATATGTVTEMSHGYPSLVSGPLP